MNGNRYTFQEQFKNNYGNQMNYKDGNEIDEYPEEMDPYGEEVVDDYGNGMD